MLNIKMIGYGKTKIFSNNKNRMINLEVASNKINNYILKSGDIFSFNAVVGPRTLENGFKVAHSISNGKLVETVGGGICQISSTLNIAVKEAKLKVIEVHKHSKEVEYAMPKDEAAVAYGILDYKFKNTIDNEIEIVSRVNIEKMEVEVAIYEKL